jgi:NDP-sugar pyrophosphorylase family protein
MRAVILAGGRGSRLKPFTVAIPKPLVPIGDMPILEILIKQLGDQGFERISLSVGYLSALIEAFCGDGSRWGVPLDYVRETEPLGTAGFLSLIDDLSEDRLLIVNGDTLTDLDMAAVWREHDPDDGATIWSSRRSVAIEFGVLETDAEGALTSYVEKPELAYDVSMGVNVLSAWAIEQLVSPGEPLDMPHLLARIRELDRTVRVRHTDAYWLDLGRMSDLELASEVFAADPKRFLP